MRFARCSMRFRRLLLCFGVGLVLLCVSSSRADDESLAAEPVATVPTILDCEVLRTRLAEAESALSKLGPELETALEAIAEELGRIKEKAESESATDVEDRKQALTARRASIQSEQKFLESAKAAWQAAADACENTASLRHDMEQFQDALGRGDVEFVAADIAALQAELNPLAKTHAALVESEAVRQQRVAELAKESTKESAKGSAKESEAVADEVGLLVRVERAALLAEIEALCHKRAEIEAKQALLEARLVVARERVGEEASASIPTTTSAPVGDGDEAAADVKLKIAKGIDAEARDRLEYARSRIAAIEAEIEKAADAGVDTVAFENDRVYWNRVEKYEQRHIRQAELHTLAARQKEAVGRLRQTIEEVHGSLERIQSQRGTMSQAQREKLATGHREQARDTLKEAASIEENARVDEKGIEPLQQLLPGIDAVENALRERLQNAEGIEGVRLLERHVREMRRQLQDERQQIDLMVTTMEVIAYAKMRQATLTRRLADIHTQIADVLVPPVPSFWERHRSVFHCIGIVAVAFVATYGVRVLVWLARWVLTGLNSMFGRAAFSVKRVGTLLGFVGSIVKVFVWVFAIVAILSEFGIDYAKSTGALGLIGLIMAGMFQQIVIDFVKGLDIIAGRHYNVGDFIEVNGMLGHVVDFNVKYTRIRALSGQEHNIPNSKCVPSRRFPDGFVDNYVDLAFKSSSDAERTEKALVAVCADLNQRIEPMKEEPSMDQWFSETGGRVTLRYLVRVLPGCPWVVTDHFVPAVKDVLGKVGVELVAEPATFFINRIETFRKLFSRRLSEEEILRDVEQDMTELPVSSGRVTEPNASV